MDIMSKVINTNWDITSETGNKDERRRGKAEAGTPKIKKGCAEVRKKEGRVLRRGILKGGRVETRKAKGN